MRPIRGLALIAGLAAFAAVTVQAGAADVKVIANPNVTASTISVADLKDVFLEVKSSVEGVAVEPVLGKRGPTHDAFLQEVLGKSDAALSTYFRSLVFTGKAAMPRTLDSDAAIAAYVAKNKGAIGYVSATASAPGTKTLDVK